MMSHYIYTKEGVQDFLGLKNTKEVRRYKQNAIKAGYKPSKIIGGVEMFDIDILLQKDKVVNNYNYSKEQLKIFATGKLF